MKKAHPPATVSVPNCITALRIIGTLCLLFVTPLTLLFFIVYTLCGVTDILDGWLARKTNSTSEFGAKLDSIADLLFYTITILKLLPVLWKLLPVWIWYLVGGVVLLRAASYVTAAIKFRRFATLHTRLNKLSGGAVFLLPYFLLLPCAVAYSALVCTVASIASIHELVLHITRTEYHANMKALF